MNKVVLGTILIAVAAALFGTLSYITRNAEAVGMDAIAFVAWRGAVATTVLLIAGWIVIGRGSGVSAGIRDMAPGRRRALVVASLLGALLNIAMFAAFLRSTIAVVLICFYSFPTLVTIGAVPLYGERLDRIRISALVLSWIGLILVVLAPAMFAGGLTIEPVGVGLAFFAAACQAAFVLIAGRGFQPLSSLRVATYAVFTAGAIAFLLAILAGNLTGLLVPLKDAHAWIWILAGGITGAAIPTTAFIAGIGLIGPSRAAILMTIEPIVGVGLAALLLGEHPSLIQLAGGAAVLVAAAILQVAPRTRAPIEPEYSPIV